MEIERRTFLRWAFAAAVTVAGPVLARTSVGGEAVYLTACRLSDGRYAIAVLDPAGRVARTLPLPDRGHGLALSPDRRTAVAFARHPREFALAFDIAGVAEPALFSAAPGRHFYGHGTFADGGRLLLATENDFDAARGVLGVYDATDDFRRIGEFDIGGIGPHELVTMPDDRTIAVAVGGIETRPASGDAKLNLATMEPSLAFLDARHGDMGIRHRLSPELFRLSIRHLAIDAAGLVWFGCQYEGPSSDLPPLVGRAGPQTPPLMVTESDDIRRSLDNYVGSVAASADGELIAVSSPRGGRILLIGRDGRVLDSTALADGCGVAPVREAAAFLATSGAGTIVRTAPGGPAETIGESGLSFDNHLAAVAA